MAGEGHHQAHIHVIDGHPDGALITKERLKLLDGEDLCRIITDETGKGRIKLTDDNGTVRKGAIANKLVEKGVRLGQLKLEELQKIASKEDWYGVSGYSLSKLVKFLGSPPPDAKKNKDVSTPKKQKTSDYKADLKRAEEQGNLTLQECARTLKKAGKMDADCTVICIIPPSLGGQNKLANYAVLPKGLLPAEPSGTSAAEAYCQLMTKILGRPMVQAAVNACGGSYQGPSVDDLATAWGDRSRKTALHPWGSSGRGGGNGAGASGSQAQEADAEADAAGTSGAQNGA